MICLERFMSFFYSIVLIILCFQLLQFDGLLCFLVSSHCEFKLFKFWTIKDIWGLISEGNTDSSLCDVL